MTAAASSAEVVGLLKARGWSLRLLLLAAVSVLAAVIYNIWSTVGFMQQEIAISASFTGPDRMDLSQHAAAFLIYAGNGPYLPPLVMFLLCGCFVLIHRPPQGGAGLLLWTTPTSRFAELQTELVVLAVLAGVAALSYTGAAVVGLTASRPLIPVEQLRGVCATILASNVATLCLLGVLLTYWWILGAPSRVTESD